MWSLGLNKFAEAKYPINCQWWSVLMVQIRSDQNQNATKNIARFLVPSVTAKRAFNNIDLRSSWRRYWLSRPTSTRRRRCRATCWRRTSGDGSGTRGETLSMELFSGRRRWRLVSAHDKPPKTMENMQGSIPTIFDCWAVPIVHVLLLKSSMPWDRGVV